MNKISLHMIDQYVGYIDGDDSTICSRIGVIKGKESSLLIDVGCSLRQYQAFKEIKLQNAFLNNIGGIILTHFHHDHIGNANRFAEYRVYGSSNTARYVHVTDIINKKTNISLGNINISVDLVPANHARGSLLIYVQEDQVMFIGDTLHLTDKEEKKYTNKDICLNMINKIKEYPTKIYIEGHNKSEFNSAEKVEKYLDFLRLTCKNSKSTDIYL